MVRSLALAAMAILFSTVAHADSLADGEAAERAGKLSEALRHYTAALQATPEGSAAEANLFRMAVGVAAKLRKPPVPPQEVLRHEGRAEAAVRGARSEQDFLDAAREYRRAARLAPWVTSYYYNMGVVFEKAGRPQEAKQAYELYLLAAPSAHDAREVQRKIAGLEYQQERAVRERDEQARRAVQEQAQREAAERDRRERERQITASLPGTWRHVGRGGGEEYRFSFVGGERFELIPVREWFSDPEIRPASPVHIDHFDGALKGDRITGRAYRPRGFTECPAHLETRMSGTLLNEGRAIVLVYNNLAAQCRGQYRVEEKRLTR